MADSLILLCNGSNGSTTFTDSSPNPKTVTAHGNAQISTAQSKSGGSSAYFDGSGDFLTIPANADLQFGGGDFTVEAWVYPTTSFGTRCIAAGQGDLATVTGSSWVFYISATATSDLYIGSTAKSAASPNPQANQWSHVAFVRYGTAFTTYLNGTQVATTALTAGAAVNTGSTVHIPSIGAFDTGANPYTGYLGGMRIEKGLARYTANFTPPSTFANLPLLAYPSTGQLTVSGQMSAILTGHLLLPEIGPIDIHGSTPSVSVDAYKGNPSIAALASIGSVADISVGVVFQPSIGSLQFSGALPIVTEAFKATPNIGDIALIGLIAKHSNDVTFARPAQGWIVLEGQSPTHKLGCAITPDGGSAIVFGNVPIFSDRVLKPIPAIWIATRYRCYLTGAENGLATDVELPISSFQTRISGESVSYLSCVLKGADRYVDEIAQRQAGKLRIWRIYVLSDGTELPFLMAEVAFEQMDLATGGKSGVTAQLSGTGNMVPQTPQSIALQHPSYFGLSGGKHRYRCEIDPRLRPGDTATVNTTAFMVGSITHIVDVKTAIMEIAEA